MVAALGASEETVSTRYWRTSGSVVQMKSVAGHCIFYDEGCSVYRGRPWRCRQWPLVPALLDDEDNFTIIRNSCPGINQEMSYREFRAVLSRLLTEDKP